MGIDGIGKGRGAPPAVDVGAKAPANEIAGGAPFRVDRGGAGSDVTQATQVTKTAPGETSPALARFRAGEIDVQGYMDLRVDEATQGLEGLPPADLAEIKRVLRDQLASDPGLAELVLRATGQAPTPPEE